MSYLCVGFSKTVKPSALSVYEICCFVPLWQSLTCELQCEECNTAIVPPHFDCQDTLWVWWFILTASLRQIQRVNQILRFADTREWQLSDFMARPRADAWRPLRNWSKNQLVCHLSSNTSLYLLLRLLCHLWCLRHANGHHWPWFHLLFIWTSHQIFFVKIASRANNYACQQATNSVEQNM